MFNQIYNSNNFHNSNTIQTMVEEAEPAPIYYYELIERHIIEDILDDKPDEEIGLDPFGNSDSSSSSSSSSDPSGDSSSSSDTISTSSNESDYIDLNHTSASDIEIVCDEVFIR